MDDSVSFERNWDEYVAGFGNVNGNFWLGLEAIHDLTTTCPMSLQIDVVPFHLPAVSIPYLQFQVGDAASEYLLTITSDTTRYNTLYNSLNFHSGMKFSTYDRDNDDGGSIHCAERFKAGWWFRSCIGLHLNGVYAGDSRERDFETMRMGYLSNDYFEPIRTVTMRIKPIN